MGRLIKSPRSDLHSVINCLGFGIYPAATCIKPQSCTIQHRFRLFPIHSQQLGLFLSKSTLVRADEKMLFVRPSAVAFMGLLSVAAAIPTAPGNRPYLSTLSPDSLQLFSESMGYMDRIYDPTAGYVFDPSTATALRHDTRTSAWYAVGLLARNFYDDADQAMRIIRNIIDSQFKDPELQWLA